MNILCIEDNDDDFNYIKYLLEKNIEGSSLYRLSSSIGMSDILIEVGFSLILVDYYLDNSETAEYIIKGVRACEEFLDIPIVVMYDLANENQKEKCVELGANLCLPKSGWKEKSFFDVFTNLFI